MYNPVSTYRIQFHKDFTFKDLEAIIPYLEQLGIGTVYASPVLKAVPGSLHGYDGVDPLQINPEIGTLEELRKLSRKLKTKGIGWVQDIVPNHMAFHSDNAWLMDVLEKGPRSKYFNFFDITSVVNHKADPLMVPFLGSGLPEVIQKGELKVIWLDGKLRFDYAGNTWPLNLAAYSTVLKAGPQAQPGAVAALVAEITRIENLAENADYTAAMAKWSTELGLLASDKSSGKWFSQAIKSVNQDTGLLKQIASSQHYRICNWQETDSKINYRRFFTVNGLICLNMQRPEVFAEFHQLIGALVKEQVFDGLRIDHIDGLYDPQKYLEQLRALAGRETFIAVEKILETGEEMPAEWPVQGNTGYDFLALINNLLAGRKGEADLAEFYRELTGEKTDLIPQIEAKKRAILTHYMAGEWENLARLFLSLEVAGKKEIAALPFADLKQAIGEFLIACPVYRFYGNAFPLAKKEAKAINKIFVKLKAAHPALREATDVLEKAVLPASSAKKSALINGLRFYQRCMQFTGPLMAKGVEDTLMYTDSHFIVHNEVGDSPEAAGLSVRRFHLAMAQRQKNWPLGMNGTSTHDTKRGEDVRARLQVLPDLAEEWLERVRTWSKLDMSEGSVPIASNDVYFVFQTLLGAYPMPGDKGLDFNDRLAQYLEKTLREGKEHSNWAEPDLEYEGAVKAFAKQLLNKRKPFWPGFEEIFNSVADFGVVNSLAQVMLKFTCPGVPDVYQGCEHWDLSLVDPDNRRPVNYGLRKKLLTEVQGIKNSDGLNRLWEGRLDGKLKIWLTRLLANERKSRPLLFNEGTYLPLIVAGKYKDHVLAYARHDRHYWYVVVVPLGLAALVKQADKITAFDWEDTRIILPEQAPENACNLILNTAVAIGKEITVAGLFENLPLALLKLSKPANKRGAGVLLPLFSLPSPFGIGDLGPQATGFADLLHSCGQKYWQMLPLSPVSAGQQYSPYSSYASFAGNEWYLSPKLLADVGLLDSEDLEKYTAIATDRVDYEKAEAIKGILLEKAGTNFEAGRAAHLDADFRDFCKQESFWLDDYALFKNLRKFHRQDPWYEWAPEYKLRDRIALNAFSKKHAVAIKRTKWLQFMFSRQLASLKAHCNSLGIQLFGDLPFYVSYDSADVWANPEMFSLDKDGNRQLVAGVPPDYFNTDGQLWGMPVFNWDTLKAQNFDWWISRIKKNLQYFDLLRLDHFRAFSSYWAVPAVETTAINGQWIKAPGVEFFTVLENELGKLPLVAEDLGDMDEEVYALRDQFSLPGMKVLQFAWGKDVATSPHIPHNYSGNFIVYTGTHDNNTTSGWYRQDTDKAMRKSLNEYVGGKVKSQTVVKTLTRLALSAVTETAIIPLQDWLNLDERARLNTPAAIVNNWVWRVTVKELEMLPAKRIAKWTERYHR